MSLKDIVDYDTYSLDDMAEDKAATAGGKTNWMTLKEGRNIFRVVPPMKGGKLFKIYFQHFVDRPDGTKAGFACPSRTNAAGKPCPACAHAKKLQDSGNALDMDLAKRFWPKQRVLVNVIDRADPEAGCKVLGITKGTFEKIRKLRESEELGGDFSHPIKGYDLCIDRTGTGLQTEYTVVASRNNSVLGPDDETMGTWIKEQNDLEPLAAPLAEAAIRTLCSGESSSKPEPTKGLTAGDNDFIDADEDPDF